MVTERENEGRQKAGGENTVVYNLTRQGDRERERGREGPSPLCSSSKYIPRSAGVKAERSEYWRRVHYGMTLTQADLLRRIRLQNETYAFFPPPPSPSLSLYSHSLACNEILTRPVWQPLKLHARLTQRA